MNRFYQIPLVTIAWATLVGISLSEWIVFPTSYLCGLPLLSIGWKWVIQRQTDLLKQDQYWQILLIFSFVVLGIGLARIPPPSRDNSSPLEALNCQKREMTGIVIDKVRKSSFGRQAWVKVIGYKGEKGWLPVQGKIDVRLRPENITPLSRHDSVRFYGYLTTLHSSSEGYASYLKLKGITHALYADTLVRGGVHKNWRYFPWRIQQFLSLRFHGLFKDTHTLSIARAMILGDKSSLERNVRQTFSVVGISHILAISGLHVGIIFMCLNFLLMFLHQIPHGKRIKHGLILAALIVYMVVTGASPAVVRATLMFGAILLMRLLRQRYIILNIVALAALIQMYVYPFIIKELGFQLSYLAVIALVCLYPKFEAYFHHPHPLLNMVYGWIGVTCIATMVTSPLIWIHFGQFPTYFLLGNVMISLFATGAVLTGFLTVMCFWIPGLNTVLATACELCIQFIWFIAQGISKSPHAVIQEGKIETESLQVILVQVLLASGLLFLPKIWHYISISMAAIKASR